jgi:hypothetical protein
LIASGDLAAASPDAAAAQELEWQPEVPFWFTKALIIKEYCSTNGTYSSISGLPAI